MRKRASYCIRVDADAKKGFEAFCDETGVSPSGVINMLMRYIVRNQRLPFDITTAPEPWFDPASVDGVMPQVTVYESRIREAVRLAADFRHLL